MKQFLSGVFLISMLFVSSVSVLAQGSITPTTAPAGYAVCDQCGYCPTNFDTKPGDWNKCVECVYPNIYPLIVDNPDSKDTLKTDPATFNPPTPMPGRMYTMLGCLKTNLTSFQTEGAAVSVIQLLLDIIFRTVGGIALLYFMYGCYVLATSQGDPERLNKGKRLVYGSIVGLIFVLLSILIVRFLASGVLKIPGFS